MSVINTNIKSLVAQDSLVQVNRRLSTAMERLSTGSRINSAKDDAAGLAISTRMEAQSRGLTMAIKNANDGISLMQTSEGAMDEVTNILQRMRELAVQSVNGTNNAADRSALDAEVQQLKEEIDRIATTTEFNSQKILDGSFKNKILQIGDKAYQTMDISIASVKTSDLGMGQSSVGGDVLVGQRINGNVAPNGTTTMTAVDAGDILINGQELGAITTADDLGDIIENINTNVDNVVASGFNEVVAKNVGTGVVSNAQLTLTVRPFGASAATSIVLSASTSMEELVDNINEEAGGLVAASINDDGKLVLSNETGATITVTDSSISGAGFGVSTTQTFTGFLKLEGSDDSSLRIERGNLGKSSPGTLADLAVLGFREVTMEPTEEKYTVTGLALTSAGVTGSWAKSELTINGVEIYDEDISTNSFAGKLAAINNFAEETGVFATAVFDKSFTVPTSGFVEGKNVSINGVIVGTGASAADFVENINLKTAEHGLVASLNGDNIQLSGENVQKLTVEHVSAAYGNSLASSITATGAATIGRTITIRSADVVEGRTLQLSAATSGGTGNFSVIYTVKAGDTKTSVAVGLKQALLSTQYTNSGVVSGTNARYMGTNTATTVTTTSTHVNLKITAGNYGNARIELSIVDGPSDDVDVRQSRVTTATNVIGTTRVLTVATSDVVAGGVYELRVVSGELVGPTGASFTVRVTATDGTAASLVTALQSAIESPTGAGFHGAVNTFNPNGLSSGAVTISGNQLTFTDDAGYGRASIHFYKVDEVLGAADTHYGAIRLDSQSNTPISVALGDSPTVAQHGLLEMNVGAADYQVNAPSLGVAFGSSLSGLNVSSASAASKAIGSIDNAIESVSSSRAKLGAYQNRLVNTVNNLDNIVTNTEASRSRIQDTDYALETTALAKAQIIQQAATAMLAQANQQPQSVLALLQ